jgi:8-oxo-dGTP diphosphatase
LWEASKGAVLTGEDSINGAKRELFEETGIRCNYDELFSLGTLVRTD